MFTLKDQLLRFDQWIKTELDLIHSRVTYYIAAQALLGLIFINIDRLNSAAIWLRLAIPICGMLSSVISLFSIYAACSAINDLKIKRKTVEDQCIKQAGLDTLPSPSERSGPQLFFGKMGPIMLPIVMTVVWIIMFFFFELKKQ